MKIKLIISLLFICFLGFGQKVIKIPKQISYADQSSNHIVKMGVGSVISTPQNFAVDSIEGGLQLSWTASAVYETEIFLSIASGSYNLIATVGLNTGTYNYLDTATVEQLNFKIRFKDDNTILSAPVLSLSEIPFGVNLIFPKPDNLAESYEWYSKTGANGTYALLANNTDTTYNHLLISTDTLYYKVRAKEGTLPVYSAYSNEVSQKFNLVGSDVNMIAWYASDLPATITKDGSNFVSRWNDRLGSGRDLIQATGTKQPVWSATGVLFDGTSDAMRTAAFAGTDYAQPVMMYFVLKQVSWTSTRRWFDGGSSTSFTMYQTGTTPNAGGTIGSAITQISPVLGTYYVFRLLGNGAGSKVCIGATCNTGNYGTNSLRGFTLGAYYVMDAFWSNIEVKEIIIRKVADGAAVETLIYNYLKNKYSL